ncbi:DNA recombination and repair protein Rad51, C-terminal, partial [Cynara cardunculus var. scolymus]
KPINHNHSSSCVIFLIAVSNSIEVILTARQHPLRFETTERMGALKSLKQEYAIIDSIFLQFCASHGIFSVEDFLVHDVYMLVASTEQLANSDRLKQLLFVLMHRFLLFYTRCYTDSVEQQGINQILSIIETYHQPWMNGLVLLEDREQNKHCLSTGCESFDMLLQGGLHEGHVTELVGPSSSGKTQVCFQFASNVAMKLGGVVFLDSGNSFSPTRMQQIVTHISGSAENKINGILQQAMRNIECHAVFDVYALLNVLHQQKLKLKSQTGYQVRLIIVDSISSLIAPILGGSNAHGEGGTLKPALGESWKNIPHVRLQLSQDHARN